MSLSRVSLVVFAFGWLVVAVPAEPAVTPPPGFVALFNGRNLTGWWGAGTEDPRRYLPLSKAELEKRRADSLADIQKHWRVENGELVNDGAGLYLTTDDFYGDFELRLEYRTVAGADSGVYLRGCPQVQIWDTTEAGGKWKHGADKGSGGLWNNSPGAPGKDPLRHADRPFGEWNQLRVILCGARTWVWLNDALVVDGAVLENYFNRRLPIPARGPIQLQTHGGEIRWRNVFLREIGAAEANARLRGTDPAGFVPLFNGRDFTGWRGATNDYEVVDGALRCRAGRGGTLFTDAQFTNFVARLEFQLPPAGNNGLALRYSGRGDPAYEGMCELQVLDSEHSRYAKLDPRQYHGSVYGMIAAQRGYLRPAGEWNYQEVTVRGSRITVELNGTPILDGDVATVTDFLGGKAHPGKDRPYGHFGFAGHNDPVAFRNISLRPLP